MMLTVTGLIGKAKKMMVITRSMIPNLVLTVDDLNHPLHPPRVPSAPSTRQPRNWRPERVYHSYGYIYPIANVGQPTKFRRRKRG
jgi:hypothetical protein